MITYLTTIVADFTLCDYCALLITLVFIAAIFYNEFIKDRP